MELIFIIFCLIVISLGLRKKRSSFLRIKEDDENLNFDDNKLNDYENEITAELEKDERMNPNEMEMQDLNNEAELDQKELQDEINHHKVIQETNNHNDD